MAVFDTSVLQSSSKLMDMLENGRKTLRTGLPQVNLDLVHSLRTGLPVMMRLFPGSISDVSTVKGLVATLRSIGSKHVSLVMDRGSTANPTSRSWNRRKPAIIWCRLEAAPTSTRTASQPPRTSFRPVHRTLSAHVYAQIDGRYDEGTGRTDDPQTPQEPHCHRAQDRMGGQRGADRRNSRAQITVRARA